MMHREDLKGYDRMDAGTCQRVNVCLQLWILHVCGLRVISSCKSRYLIYLSLL